MQLIWRARISRAAKIVACSCAVSSKLPVTLTQDGNVVRGQSMRHDERTGVTVLGGRVTGQYQVPGR